MSIDATRRSYLSIPMRYAEVAENVKALARDLPSPEEFVYEFLLAYGTPNASIARLKSGQMNLAKSDGELLLKKLFFKPAEGDLFAALEALKTAKGTQSNAPRFLFVTDFEQVVAFDRKTEDSLACALSELGSHFDFFLPLANMEKQLLSNESHADIKAAERMAKLFDAIMAHNPEFIEQNSHAMNVFLARLLFCFFAEDTGIFKENVVSSAIATETAPDASDLHDFFVKLFDLLDRKPREGLSEPWSEFPYVNGGLFKDHYPIPEFSMKARRMMIEAGTLNWADINPDIFGSMFQAVIDPKERHNLGQHYTSVTNIMKVIEPLFLNDFRETFEKASALKRGKAPALHRLLERIAKVKIFDPACGSGNFLIIAYKMLRRLEMDIFSELQKDTGELPLSGLKVSQFYGIEISDFAAETAVLALWLAEHQMNLESKKICGQAPDNLPLREGAHITCDNACRIDWKTACPKEADDEIYILGNPPYYGSSLQTEEQKRDLTHVFLGLKNYKNLDYIANWFLMGSQYIENTQIKLAFVTTDSICQGEQVDMLWPHIFSRDLEISFVHQSFYWSNNAKNQAAVSCIIVGLRNKSDSRKWIYSLGLRREVQNINPYLVASNTDLIIRKRRKPISSLPKMTYGNKPTDGGNLILSTQEKKDLLKLHPTCTPLVRELMGAHEFTEGLKRWCLWIENHQIELANSILPIAKRLENVRIMRAASKKTPTRELAKTPHLFGEIRHKNKISILVPRHGSNRRKYMPFGFLGDETIVNDSVQVVYTEETYVFGLISSRIHNVWIKATCGKIKQDPRYSSSLGYNNFPVPNLSTIQKQALTAHVMEVLQQRENHPEKTMAQLYDPDKMPEGLRAAHHQLDLAVERLYRKAPFTSDEERLEHLFKRYEAMIKQERNQK
ncbi:N-6 DNA methylase [Opitutales bacterium]|nr:N-6 DNA methylase [Opitutales bacterium]